MTQVARENRGEPGNRDSRESREDAGRPRRSRRLVRRPGLRRRLLLLVCWSALTVAAALNAVRLTGADAGTILALPVAALPYAAAGIALLLAVFALLRARWSVLLSAVLLLGELVWLAPRFLPDGVTVAADAPRLRVATSNTQRGEVDAAALVELVRRERIDVLAAQELPVGGIRALEAAGLSRLLPHRELHPEADSSIYSRFPLVDSGVLHRPTTWPQTYAEVMLGGRQVRLVSVHTLYPLGDPQRWRADLTALRTEALVNGRDVVLLGDFNATLDHASMRRLLSTGLVDSHAEVGRGLAPTWPVGHPWLPLMFQLDHVLHGPGLVAGSVQEYSLPGTDHRAVVAELSLTG